MSKHFYGRWVACAALVVLSATDFASAQVPPAAAPPAGPPPAGAAPAASASLSVTGIGKRAGWQEHLTLGAGDVLNLSLLIFTPGTTPNGGVFTPNEVRTEVPIGPDGRISFLQARDVMAAGLTVDELRAKLDEALGAYYQNPRTVVIPVLVKSKKFVMMGAVANRGVFVLDRPLTVIEAIARAGGLQTGLYENNTVEMTDLQHSFLVRNGQRVPVDFERLFQRGDFSQNVPLEPDDYLFFASAGANEIYVLGEVASPGILLFAPHPTALNAIASRGGYTDRAYRQRVLVVRGSLTHPETFVVEAAKVMKGKAADFKLQPRDIVYVSQSGWVKAQEIIDTAARAFIYSTVTTFATKNIY
jgi:protein involved in polysaccharide export with SLBB domain